MTRSKSWLGQLRFISGLTGAVDNSSWSGYKSFVSLDMLCNLKESQTIHDFESNQLKLILSDSESTIIPWFKSDEPWFYDSSSQENGTFRWFSPNSVLNRTHINFRGSIICLILENEPRTNINPCSSLKIFRNWWKFKMKKIISNSIFGSVLIFGLVSANQYKWKSILPQWNTGQVLFFKWNEYRILDYGKRLKSS